MQNELDVMRNIEDVDLEKEWIKRVRKRKKRGLGALMD
jgi:hypothetical protein